MLFYIPLVECSIPIPQTELLSDKAAWTVTALSENDAALHAATFAIDKKLADGGDFLYKSSSGQPAFHRMKIDVAKKPVFVIEVVLYLQRDNCCESHDNIEVRQVPMQIVWSNSANIFAKYEYCHLRT